MSDSYKTKLIKNFLNDVRNVNVDFLISKDLSECSIEEIEWVIEVVGDWSLDLKQRLIM